MKVSFNVNYNVEVVLRKRGAELLNKHRDELIAAFPNAKMDTSTYKEGDIYTEQMWRIMNLFGEAMLNGVNPPFETKITLHIPD